MMYVIISSILVSVVYCNHISWLSDSFT